MPYIRISGSISLFYEEFGSGDNYILSSQAGFYKKGMQQYMAGLGYHVICITIRGFAPSSFVDEDYGSEWYNKFADDVVAVADAMGIERFVYMGASHGAGIGWHLMLRHPERVSAFIAVVAGPHSLKEGTMSYRQMLEQGIIKSPPPFDPEIDDDPARQQRRWPKVPGSCFRPMWRFPSPVWPAPSGMNSAIRWVLCSSAMQMIKSPMQESAILPAIGKRYAIKQFAQPCK